jgi:hypothetical protein
MRITVKIAIAGLIAIPVIGGAQQLSCVKDITYSQEFLAKFPRAGAACNEVVAANGQKWVRYTAEVKGVEGNHLTVAFIDNHENPVSTMTFAFDPTARVTMENNEEKAASTLEEGQKVKVWMPENKIGFYAGPGAAKSQHFALVTTKGATKE